MKSKIRFTFLFFVSLSLFFGAFPINTKTEISSTNSQELELFIHFQKSPELQYSSNWGSKVNGRYLAFLGTFTGTSIVDVTEPGENHAGKELAYIEGSNSSWREMKDYYDPVSGHTFLYIVTEGFPGGLQIVDLSLSKPELISTFWRGEQTEDGDLFSGGTSWENQPHWPQDNSENKNHPSHKSPELIPIGGDEKYLTSHTLVIDPVNARLYLNGSRSQIGSGMVILNISNPIQPQELGVYGPNSYDNFVHDGFIRDSIYYAALINTGHVKALDVKDHQNLKEVFDIQTPQKFTHSIWLTDGSKFLFAVDEVSNNHLLTYDIQDIQSIKLISKFRDPSIPPKAILHQFMLRGNLLSCAWYTEGIRVVDVSNPYQPFEAGHYPTWQGPSGGFNGCWGIYVDDRGYSYGSDMYNRPEYKSGGLFVVRFPVP
ncbi:MAG: hypothetical protein HYW77_02510 [Parcubacteria group bacterium]|nr:hypothetical protein [Parcubacteria group bacterium]